MVTRGGCRGRTGARPAGALVLALMLAAGLGAAGRVEAGPNLTFTLTPQSGEGRISFAGGAAPLIADGLGVASVTGLGTGAHPNGLLTIDGGTLSFQTGPSSGQSGSGGEVGFAQGGTIELDGKIPTLGINQTTKLLSGSFSDEAFVKSLSAGTLKVQGGAFLNVVNPILAAYYGLPTGGTQYFGGLATLFSAPSTSGGFSSSSLTSGSVTTEPVPEPGTLLVFAALASGGVACAWRRRGNAG